MNRNLLALGLLPLLIAGCAQEAKTLTPTQNFSPTRIAELNEAVDLVMRDWDIPGVMVGVWIPGEGEWVAAKGTSNLATNSPMNLDMHFRVGSNTKAFTGTVVLQLVDEGLIELDQTIEGYFPWVKRADEITIRMMLNMTSGLANYSEQPEFDQDLWTNPRRNWTRQGVLDYVKDMDLLFDPGTQYHYSNTNTVLLGMIIEQETGKSVAQNFIERIYTPLGMSQTSWPTTAALPSPFTHGFTYDTLDKNREDSYDWNPNWADAAGQLVSTMSDMKSWAEALGTGSLISPEMQQQRLQWVTVPGSSQVSKYGLAIAEVLGWINHQGQMPGYNSIAAYRPSNGAVVVVMANSETSHNGRSPAEALVLAIHNIFYGQP